jgi:hypothetical protein
MIKREFLGFRVRISVSGFEKVKIRPQSQCIETLGVVLGTTLFLFFSLTHLAQRNFCLITHINIGAPVISETPIGFGLNFTKKEFCEVVN